VAGLPRPDRPPLLPVLGLVGWCRRFLGSIGAVGRPWPPRPPNAAEPGPHAHCRGSLRRTRATAPRRGARRITIDHVDLAPLGIALSNLGFGRGGVFATQPVRSAPVTPTATDVDIRIGTPDDLDAVAALSHIEFSQRSAPPIYAALNPAVATTLASTTLSYSTTAPCISLPAAKTTTLACSRSSSPRQRRGSALTASPTSDPPPPTHPCAAKASVTPSPTPPTSGPTAPATTPSPSTSSRPTRSPGPSGSDSASNPPATGSAERSTPLTPSTALEAQHRHDVRRPETRSTENRMLSASSTTAPRTGATDLTVPRAERAPCT
jgi:hypothetical protein